MLNFRRKYPVLVSIVLMVLFPVVSILGVMPLLLWDSVWEMGEYLPQLLVEIILIIVMTLAAVALKMRYVFLPSDKPLHTENFAVSFHYYSVYLCDAGNIDLV